MDIKAEKLNLIQWLTQLTDPKVIEQIKALKEQQVDWWDGISETEQQAIDEGLGELDRGEGIPHEQVMKEVKSKYGK